MPAKPPPLPPEAPLRRPRLDELPKAEPRARAVASSEPVVTEPYRAAFAGPVGSALFAALIVCAVDVALTYRSAQGAGGGDLFWFALIALGLYLGAALAVGLFQGLMCGAFWATHPRGGVRALWRTLAGDADL